MVDEPVPSLFTLAAKSAGMNPFSGGVPHCKRCGRKLSGTEEQCDGCGFSPKYMLLRVSLSFLLVVVVAMAIVMVVPPLSPTIAAALVALAGIGFVLTVLTLLASFLVTPSRFGSLFTRL